MRPNEDQTEQVLARLALLYEEDPEQFEEQRQFLIQRTIEDFPEEYRQRAYGLQFRLDAQLRKYKNPVARMNKMVEIFWQNFEEFVEVLNDPNEVLRKRREGRTEGRILLFPGNKNPSLH